MSGRREVRSDSECISLIVERLGRGEAMVSDMRDITNIPRVGIFIDMLLDKGLVRYRVKEKGQKRPVYSLTESGRVFLAVDRLRRDILQNGIGDDPERLERLNELVMTLDSRR